MNEPSVCNAAKKKAGLISALGLLAHTAPAEVVRFFPDPIADTGYNSVSMLSWNPSALEYVADDADQYPGTHAAAMYGCFGNLELAVGTPGGVEYLLIDTYTAPALALNDTVDPSHTQWTGSGTGWQASMDMDGVTFDTPFYIGYRIHVLGSDYLYGYAQMAASYDDGDHLTRITASEWAYETTPNTGITITAIPEPGMLALLLFGAFGLALRRCFRRR